MAMFSPAFQGEAMCNISYAFDERPWASTGGDGGWVCSEKNIPTTPVCDWDGVFCDGIGSVTSISYSCPAPANSVGGTLSPSIGHLSNMTTLYLKGGCDIGGPVPESILRLTKLRVLSLWDNKFTGPVPALNDKARLKAGFYFLHIKKNHFSGKAPDFREFEGMETYEFGDNELEGKLPCAPASVTTYNADGNANMTYCYPADCPEMPPHAESIYEVCSD